MCAEFLVLARTKRGSYSVFVVTAGDHHPTLTYCPSYQIPRVYENARLHEARKADSSIKTKRPPLFTILMSGSTGTGWAQLRQQARSLETQVLILETFQIQLY